MEIHKNGQNSIRINVILIQEYQWNMCKYAEYAKKKNGLNSKDKVHTGHM